MNAMKVNRGIFIDNECSGIWQIADGFIIPANGPTHDTNEEYHQDLAIFLKKWFEISVTDSTQDES